jgi:hypothetical protein
LKLEKIDLPRKYEYKEGITNPLYERFNGWNKVSYSQLGSIKEYKAGYLQDYILGVGTGESGIFASYGSAVGEYFEDGTVSELLSESDIEVINRLKKHESSIFEAEVVIDLEPFGLEKTCLQGFSDHEYMLDVKKFIEDLKTGNSTNMQAKYGDMDKYFQTRVYAYQRENEGFEIGGCRVNHLGRKGNNTTKGDKNCLRLSGDIDYIETPYKREDVEKYLKETVIPLCKEISEYFITYQKYFGKKE